MNFFEDMKEFYKKKTDGARSVFYNSTGGRMYYREAPQKCEYPYAVYFSPTPATNEDTFSEVVSDIDLQVNIYSKKHNPQECSRLLKECREVFENAEIPVADHEPTQLTREFYIDPEKINDDVWQATLTLKTRLTEKAR